uniref:SAS-6_N domain-containing protein n=1 Tax=Caenorhabditis tropicalis TaxID=1561998 RepID=A0A1I7TMV2_9PELO
MNSKPVGYESSKAIFSFLDPNMRLAVSLRNPSNRTAERAVPLKINELTMDNHKIVVDGTTYECAIYQMNCCENKPPFRVSGRNELNGRWTCDVDDFGIPDYITQVDGRLKSILDVQKQRHKPLLQIQLETELEIRDFEATIEADESYYLFRLNPEFAIYDLEAKMEADGSNLLFELECRRSHDRLFNEEELSLLKNEEHLQSAISYMKKRIDLMEKLLLPFENQSKNIRPKFEIHVTKHQGDSTNVLERVNYTGNLHKAVNSLREFMFSKRLHAVVVTKLNISQDCPIPMPRQLKMNITELNLGENVTTELVEPIINASSSPLEKLHIFVNNDTPQKMDLEFIRTAKVLNIYKNQGTVLPLILNLVNQKVNIQLSHRSFLTDEEFVVLIRTYRTEENISQTFHFIVDQFEEAITEFGFISIPTENLTVIIITYEYIVHQGYGIRMRVLPWE